MWVCGIFPVSQMPFLLQPKHLLPYKGSELQPERCSQRLMMTLYFTRVNWCKGLNERYWLDAVPEDMTIFRIPAIWQCGLE